MALNKQSIAHIHMPEIQGQGSQDEKFRFWEDKRPGNFLLKNLPWKMITGDFFILISFIHYISLHLHWQMQVSPSQPRSSLCFYVCFCAFFVCTNRNRKGQHKYWHKTCAILGVVKKIPRHFCILPDGDRPMHRHALGSLCHHVNSKISEFYWPKWVRIAHESPMNPFTDTLGATIVNGVELPGRVHDLTDQNAEYTNQVQGCSKLLFLGRNSAPLLWLNIVNQTLLFSVNPISFPTMDKEFICTEG